MLLRLEQGSGVGCGRDVGRWDEVCSVKSIGCAVAVAGE